MPNTTPNTANVSRRWDPAEHGDAGAAVCDCGWFTSGPASEVEGRAIVHRLLHRAKGQAVAPAGVRPIRLGSWSPESEVGA
jgi:hypothetical protein